MSLDLFHPATRAWFERTFEAPTEAQERGWPSIRSGSHTLIAAPTGSGKTLAAFLAAIDELVREGLDYGLADENQVVYVSPLKALTNDIHTNLEVPLAGIREELGRLGLPDVEVRAAARTGDTTQYERRKMVRTPPHILVTTPESLYILLTSDGGRSMLETARTVIVDEIHAMAGDKRGSHLAATLERLDELVGHPLTRVGLSATQRPIEEVAHFLTGTGGLNGQQGSRRPSVVAGLPIAGGSADTAGSTGESGAARQARVSNGTGGATGGAGSSAGAADLDRAWPDCTIIDTGHQRELDLAIELPDSPLEALMSNEVWEDIYDRIAELVEEHESTLIFVNTRRLCERTVQHLTDRLGEANVAAHHGSLSKETRFESEERLRAGELPAMVATASLELGIDIGAVDLVCQLGSTRSISTLLQRVGRSGHFLGGVPKGRIFPLSRDELVEAVALFDAVRRGELDRLVMPERPLELLAQQIVAEVAVQEWHEDDLFDVMRRAWPFRDLERSDYDDVVRMLAEGFSTRRGRRGAHVHHDRINGMLKPRRGAKLKAITSGGSIPEVNDFSVILEPQGTFIGTLDQDFAIESLPGDIFQLGNQSYRILRIEQQGKLRVEDAHGQPPTIPFWIGEAPGRTHEASEAVSRLRGEIGERLKEGLGPEEIAAAEAAGIEEIPAGGTGPVGEGSEGADGKQARSPRTPTEAADAPRLVPKPEAVSNTIRWLQEEVGIGEEPARQVVEYLAAGQAALGVMPTQEDLVVERFFDDAGDMHVVLHSPYGSRLNRAWGLSLRKRFCRSFNFELQASATEDAIILSLGPTHSFPLGDVFKFLKAASVRELLVQALLDAPMFPTRWRWNATRALAVLRWRNGKKVPPHLQQADAEDLIAVVFPDQLACLENIAGDREIPDHPLVEQTIRDCLEEAMDIDHLEELLERIQEGRIALHARDLREPSPFSQEIIVARPYAFLDDGEAEERRTLNISSRRWMDPETAADIGRLDAAAIARVREQAWPEARDADELHDALMIHGFVTEEEGRRGDLDDEEGLEEGLDVALDGNPEGTDGGWTGLFRELVREGRATRLHTAPEGPTLWVAAERLPWMRPLFPEARIDPVVELPGRLAAEEWTAHDALVEVARGRLECEGPVTAAELAGRAGVSFAQVDRALLALEAEGFAIRGRFTPTAVQAGAGGDPEWCDRRLLARIHRYTIDRKRREIEPVSPRDFLVFLLRWHRLDGEPAQGPESLEALVEQLEGFSAPAAAWESEILPARLAEYDPVWLDSLCMAGRVTWGRLPPPGPDSSNGRRSGPIRTTPVTLVRRDALDTWRSLGEAPTAEEASLSSGAVAVLRHLEERGASFFGEIADAVGLLDTRLEDALGELVAWGLVTADSFTGLRALLVPSNKRPPVRGGKRKGSVALFGVENAGRWSLLWPGSPGAVADEDGNPDEGSSRGSRPGWQRHDPEVVEVVGRVLLRRYGVVFRKLLEREGATPPWRHLLRVFRRLEARGEIRGGRFVAGFSGEQFALPEAVGKLRKARSDSDAGALVSVSAADPLNLVGILTPGDRIPAVATNRVLYRDGVPLAALQAGEARFFEELEDAARWEAKNALVRRTVPPRLRQYLGRSA